MTNWGTRWCYRVLDEHVVENREPIGRYYTLKKNYLVDEIIGHSNRGVSTRLKIRDQMTMLLQIKPKSVNEDLEDESWIEAMKKEINQFQKNEVWTLVEPPFGKAIIGAKWVFKNKLDEQGKVVRNKVSIVAKGYL